MIKHILTIEPKGEVEGQTIDMLLSFVDERIECDCLPGADFEIENYGSTYLDDSDLEDKKELIDGNIAAVLEEYRVDCDENLIYAIRERLVNNVLTELFGDQ